MAIPTPKTPIHRNEDKTSPKATSPSTKTVTKTIVQKNQNQVQKKLPTPPSRASHQAQKQSSSTDLVSTIISFLIIVSIGIGLWTYKGPIISYLESLGLRGEDHQTIQDPNSLFVGKEIELDGKLNQTPNQNYTHSFVHSIYGTIGVRSTTINLNNYIGQVHIQGQVIDFIDNTYIIEISNLSPINNNTTPNTGEYISGLIYLPDAHIIFRDMSAEGITVSNTTNILTFTNTTNKATMTARYFTCDKTVAHNCKRFSESFKNSVGIDFADSFGNVFYRLSDANTWFVSLDDKIGIYLETTDPTMIPLVIKNMQFITNNWAAKKFTADIVKSICVSSNTQLTEPFNVSVVSHDGEPAVSISSSTANCLISINPNNTLGGRLISISGGSNAPVATGSEVIANTQEEVATIAVQETAIPVQETTTQTPNTTTQTTSNLSAGNTPQIPLKPGKELKFSIKSAGYTLIFPSPVISYSSFSVKDQIAGLSCRIGSNVTSYTDRDNVDTKPSLIVYGCKKGSPQLESNMLSFDAKDMTFVVQVNDNAWIDFAKNIKVE